MGAIAYCFGAVSWGPKLWELLFNWPKELELSLVQTQNHGSYCSKQTSRGQNPEIALRNPLEAHFEHFWALLPKWLSGSLCRFILSISGPCSRNGTQGRVCIAPVWPKSLSITPVHLKNALGVPFGPPRTVSHTPV